MSLDWGPRTCEQCGKSFQPTRWMQKTCSAECREARLRAWHAAWKRREWARKHPKIKEERPCVVCGNTFQPVKPCDKTCGAECRAQRKRDLANGRNHGTLPQLGNEPRECVQCGKSFLGHHNAITCSAACMRLRKRDAQRAGKVWHCIACGQPFQIQGKNDRYTCSPSCRRAAIARKNKRAATPERNAKMVAKVRQRKAEDPAYRAKMAERDRAQRRKEYLQRALIDVMRISEYEDRIGSPIEERHAGAEPGRSAQIDAVAFDGGSQG